MRTSDTNEFLGYLDPNKLCHVDSPPESHGCIRVDPEDFKVDEELGYPLSGEGQHVWLRIRKRLLNTVDVAKALARVAGVGSAALGYAGLKDRNAVATQWFSVDLAGREEPDWLAALPEGCELVSVTRNTRKLRRGGLAGNRFELVLRELHGDLGGVEDRLTRIKETGVPNYYGPQRFGRGGANVGAAHEMLAQGRRIRDRHRRGLYISAARALLFNRVLSQRVSRRVWHLPIDGDLLMLQGSRSVFPISTPDECLYERARKHDLHPTGPLWGAGKRMVADAARQLEDEALVECGDWRAGLEAIGLKQERRSLRVGVAALEWELNQPARLSLRFSLPRGAYATAVVRELVNV